MQHPSHVLAAMSEILKAGRQVRPAFNGAERLVTNDATLEKLIGVARPAPSGEPLYMGVAISSHPMVPPGVIMGFRKEGVTGEKLVWCNTFDVAVAGREA